MKIRVVHILNNLSSSRENASVECMSSISNYNIEYIQYITPKYNNDAWLLQTPIDGWSNHSRGHFGAFLSFKYSVLNYFTDDLDAFLIVESDCVLGDNISFDFFTEQLYSSIIFSIRYNVFMFSFGSRYYNTVLQSPIIKLDDKYPNFCLTDKIILNHCILFTSKVREVLLFEYIHNNWDSPDIWHNTIYNKYSNLYNLGITTYPIMYQHEGVSSIDNIMKYKS
jgi:hypothetical protein